MENYTEILNSLIVDVQATTEMSVRVQENLKSIEKRLGDLQQMIINESKDNAYLKAHVENLEKNQTSTAEVLNAINRLSNILAVKTGSGKAVITEVHGEADGSDVIGITTEHVDDEQASALSDDGIDFDFGSDLIDSLNDGLTDAETTSQVVNNTLNSIETSAVQQLVQPVAQPVVQPAVQQPVQPVAQPIAQPVAQPVVQQPVQQTQEADDFSDLDLNDLKRFSF